MKFWLYCFLGLRYQLLYYEFVSCHRNYGILKLSVKTHLLLKKQKTANRIGPGGSRVRKNNPGASESETQAPSLASLSPGSSSDTAALGDGCSGHAHFMLGEFASRACGDRSSGARIRKGFESSSVSSVPAPGGDCAPGGHLSVSCWVRGWGCC